MQVTGTTTFMNPYGYLPGQYWSFHPFYMAMTVCYAIAAALWFILCACYWRELMSVQNWICLVLGISMLEMILK